MNRAGFLDDYALLLQALLELLQTEFRSADLDWARQLGDGLLELFHDREKGGFWFTAHDQERLIHRPMTAEDHSYFSGNAAAALSLGLLGRILGEQRYAEAARGVLDRFHELMVLYPSMFPGLLLALEAQLRPPRLVILRGPAGQIESWKDKLFPLVLRDTVVLATPEGTNRLPPALERPRRNHPVAFVCSGTACLPEVDRLEDLLSLLRT